MNRIEIYNKVRNHLLSQGQKALDERNPMNCLYRTNDGLKCAIGCLISDDVYKPEIEGESLRNLIEDFGFDETFGVSMACLNQRNEDIRFLEELQYIHDEDDPEDWEESLDAFYKTLVKPYEDMLG